MINLVCVHAFGKYEKGQLVSDQAEIDALMADDRHNQFVQISVADPDPVDNTPAVTPPVAPFKSAS